MYIFPVMCPYTFPATMYLQSSKDTECGETTLVDSKGEKVADSMAGFT
jgi:hypothetical protein